MGINAEVFGLYQKYLEKECSELIDSTMSICCGESHKAFAAEYWTRVQFVPMRAECQSKEALMQTLRRKKHG